MREHVTLLSHNIQNKIKEIHLHFPILEIRLLIFNNILLNKQIGNGNSFIVVGWGGEVYFSPIFG